MFKKIGIGVYFKFWILMLGFISMIIGIGCGQQSTTTTTTLPATATASISGTLKSGTISGASVKAAGVKILAVAFAALPDYNVVAVSKDSGKIYFASSETSSTGEFTIPNLPTTESFYIDVLDSDNKLVAPLSFGSTGGKPVMAVEPGAQNVNLSEITFDSTEKIAAPTTEPTSLLDTSASVEAKSGKTLVPKGAGNFGKGSGTEFSGTYNAGVADGDKDGLPNIVDADNNGDLIADEFDGMYTKEVFSETSPPNFYAYAFTNLKVDWSNRTSFKTNYDEFTIALGVTPNSKGGSAKTIQSCKLIKGPAWVEKAYIATASPKTLWKDSSYDIPKKSGSDAYEVQLGGNSPATLKPGADVTAGDTLKIQVIFTDGTSEETIKMINFVFTDIPSITAYKVGSAGSWLTPPSTGNHFGTFTSSEVYLRWTRPLDESSIEIKGAKYTFEYNAASGGAKEKEVIAKDTSTASSLEGGVNFATLLDANLTADPLLIGLCIRSVASDNSAENIWFTKGW